MTELKISGMASTGYFSYTGPPAMDTALRPYHKISKYTHVDIRYAAADITQAKEMTFDFIFDSLSKTAMDVIHDITRVMSAMTVILLMMPAQFLRRKHSRAITRTVIRYFSHPPRLKITGMSSAAHIMPSKRHFKISIIRLSICKLLPYVCLRYRNSI